MRRRLLVPIACRKLDAFDLAQHESRWVGYLVRVGGKWGGPKPQPNGASCYDRGFSIWGQIANGEQNPPDKHCNEAILQRDVAEMLGPDLRPLRRYFCTATDRSAVRANAPLLWPAASND
jgi:hypothetical protein